MFLVQVKLTAMELPTELPNYLARIRQLQLNDRALMDRAAKAFVSYIHSYSKHECNVLLRVKGDYFVRLFKVDVVWQQYDPIKLDGSLQLLTLFSA